MVVAVRNRHRTPSGLLPGWAAPLLLALVGFGLPTGAWRLLPHRTLSSPRPMRARRLPPLELLQGRGLARTARIVNLQVPAGGTLLLRLQRPPSSRAPATGPIAAVRVHWALGSPGRAVASTGMVEAPDRPGVTVTRRLVWTGPGPHVLHLVAESAAAPVPLRVGVAWVAAPPPWIEQLLSLLLIAPLAVRLLAAALRGSTEGRP